MSDMVFIETSEVSNYTMKELRQGRDLDKYDTSEDEEILKMSGFEFLDEWLKRNGIIGYTADILDAIYAAYGIDLMEYPFDEPIQRIKEEE